jgi:hypothetical protein
LKPLGGVRVAPITLHQALLKEYQMRSQSKQPSNKTIFDQAIEEVVEEAWGGGGSTFGGAPGGGAGTRTGAGIGGASSQQTGNKTWHPGSPPFRGMTGSPGGQNTIDISQESEEFAREARKNKPFPLEQVNEYLVDAFVALSNAELQLNSCVKYNKVLTTNKEKKALLGHCHRKVQAVKEMIRSISQDFDRITLS